MLPGEDPGFGVYTGTSAALEEKSQYLPFRSRAHATETLYVNELREFQPGFEINFYSV